jgi:hypothetical protein
MAISEQDISGVTEAVWASTLDLGVQTAPVATSPADAARLVGRVQITGAWTGSVLLVCAGDLARTAAAAIFGGAPEETSDSQARDALAEIINMTAGNLKALLPEPCQLGLPAVAGVDGFVAETTPPDARGLTEVGFTCQGRPFVVRVVAATDA